MNDASRHLLGQLFQVVVGSYYPQGLYLLNDRTIKSGSTGRPPSVQRAMQDASANNTPLATGLA